MHRGPCSYGQAQPCLAHPHFTLQEAEFNRQQPHSHDAIAVLALQAITLFERLLLEISHREGFGDADDDDGYAS